MGAGRSVDSCVWQPSAKCRRRWLAGKASVMRPLIDVVAAELWRRLRPGKPRGSLARLRDTPFKLASARGAHPLTQRITTEGKRGRRGGRGSSPPVLLGVGGGVGVAS